MLATCRLQTMSKSNVWHSPMFMLTAEGECLGDIERVVSLLCTRLPR